MSSVDPSIFNRTILDLPDEVIEHILRHDDLDHQDLGSFAQVCKFFNRISNSNELWKIKLQQRWPGLYERCERKSWQSCYDIFKQRLQYGQKTRHLVSGLSAAYYDLPEMSRDGFAPFIVMMDESDDVANFIVDELLIQILDSKRHENLTEKYYAEKVLRHLHQIQMRKQWLHFLQISQDKQKFETGAVLIAKWCQPTLCVTEEKVNNELDRIASLVQTEVGHRSPHHPLCSAPLNMKPLTEHLWTSQQSKIILETLNFVLFEMLGFRGNQDNYYDPNNSYINKVLERRKGIPITLAVVYSAVARRLGVLCEAVNFPSHFLLRWLDKPLASLHQMYVYIDVFRGGRFYRQSECCQAIGIPESIGSLEENYMSASTKKLLERMARNLIGIGRHQSEVGDGLLCLRNALDLFLIICPDDLEMRLLQVRINLHLNINLTDVIDSLQHVADLDPARMGLVAYLLQEAQMQLQDNRTGSGRDKVKAKLRKDNPSVEFSVGMVMKHKRYDYTCVIYGWDETCKASEEWIIQMGVDNLSQKHLQPFYNVLVEDGSNRYAAQENMLYTDSPREITHPEVGRYFQTFIDTHYVMNPEKNSQYPDDAEVTRKLIQDYYGDK